MQHFQVCLECASFAPLAGAHGGQVQALALERVVTRLPAGLADAADAANVGAPAIIVIGEVVALRERLRWFDADGGG